MFKNKKKKKKQVIEDEKYVPKAFRKDTEQLNKTKKINNKKRKKGKNFISRFLSKAITTDKRTNTQTTYYNGRPVTKNRRK